MVSYLGGSLSIFLRFDILNQFDERTFVITIKVVVVSSNMYTHIKVEIYCGIMKIQLKTFVWPFKAHLKTS